MIEIKLTSTFSPVHHLFDNGLACYSRIHIQHKFRCLHLQPKKRDKSEIIWLSIFLTLLTWLNANDAISYTGETKRTFREWFIEHRQSTNNPGHANALAAFRTYLNLPDDSLTDILLIPLELQPSENTARRKAREGYFIEKCGTLSPYVVTKTNEASVYIFVLYFIFFFFVNCVIFLMSFTFIIYLSCIFIPYTVTFYLSYSLVNH